jgi:hypothetical protein
MIEQSIRDLRKVEVQVGESRDGEHIRNSSLLEP